MVVPTLQRTDKPPPTHVAIIMDGNGRWAKARGLPRTAGHAKGAEAVRRTVEAAGDQGIRYLTLFGFSSENWKRPKDEIGDLMGLMRRYLRSEIAEIHAQGIRLKVIGERPRLDTDIVALIEDAEALTKDNERMMLVLAISYGARQELAGAVRQLARAVQSGDLAPEDIDEAAVGRSLMTAGIPDPDMLIRTSGEQRISNFLLWQLAYTELVFVDRLWPDFGATDLADAITEFHRRDRRYGATDNSLRAEQPRP